MRTLNVNLLMILLLGTGFLSNIMAQTPEGIIYQAEARDAQGRLYAKQKLNVMITIIQDDVNGSEVYEEWHKVSTSEYGIFSLVIGRGENPNGVFKDIDWGNHPHFLNVQVEDPKKGTMINMGTSQLLSVPYALHAKTAETALGSVSETDPVFSSSPSFNIEQTDISKWNDAVTKAYVDNLANEIMNMTSKPNESFTSPTTGILMDVDINSYKTIKIGGQWWMVENLKTTKYNDRTAIPLVIDNTAWSILETPGYCCYNNDQETYGNTYGNLYNWYVVQTEKLCPDGWHVPSDAEWRILTTFLGGVDVAGGKMKETGTAHWNEPNTGATNESGFTGLPGGLRVNGFSRIGTQGLFWSSTEDSSTDAFYRELSYSRSKVERDYDGKRYGLSVRCVRDN